ncbi:MAG: FHA domain-containing protein [Eubacteriales bacterium]
MKKYNRSIIRIIIAFLAIVSFNASNIEAINYSENNPETTIKKEVNNETKEEIIGDNAINSELIITTIIMCLLTIVILILLIILFRLIIKQKRNDKTPLDYPTKKIKLEPFSSEQFKAIVCNVNEKTIIGRNKRKSDIVFSFDKDVKDRHLILSYTNNHLYISKVLETTELFINGLPIQGKRELSNKDVISFANIEMIIKFE